MSNGVSQAQATIWEALVYEDGSFSILARLTSLDGTGSEVIPGEGACLKAADITSIAIKVYDIGSDKEAISGNEVHSSTLTVASVIFDTLRTVGWAEDLHGYNFRHDVAGTVCVSPGTASQGEWYRLEYLVTMTNGAVFPVVVRVKTLPVIRS